MSVSAIAHAEAGDAQGREYLAHLRNTIVCKLGICTLVFGLIPIVLRTWYEYNSTLTGPDRFKVKEDFLYVRGRTSRSDPHASG